MDSNPYTGILRDFQEAWGKWDNSIFFLDAHANSDSCGGWQIGSAQLPGVPRKKSTRYTIEAHEIKCSGPLACYEQLAAKAGAFLPRVIREMLGPSTTGDAATLWTVLLWWHDWSYSERRGSRQTDFMLEMIGNGDGMPSCLAWLRPFHASIELIEQCRLNTSAPTAPRSLIRRVPWPASCPVPAADIAGDSDPQPSDGPSGVDPPVTDGPLSPNVFCRNGVAVSLPPMPWRLVQILWKAPTRTMSKDDVFEEVWGNDPGENALRAAAARANKCFELAGVAVAVRQKNGHVQLDVEAL